jgi:hypothetical protein
MQVVQLSTKLTDRSSEGDLGNVGVLAHGGTEVIVAADDLEDTRRQNLLCKLDELEGCVGGEGRWLGNDSVTGHQSGRNLAGAEDQGEVPWADSLILC